MGSVRRDSRGTGWQARYRDRAGAQRTKTFSTKADANRYLAAVETELARGTWTDPALTRVRFGVFAARWRESLSHVRPGTLANLDSRLRCHVLPAFGTWQIGSIDPADVREWIAQLVEKGLSPGTIAGTYHLLGRILKTAEIDGLIPHTPCVGIRLPRQDTHTEMHFLGPNEVAQLAEAIEPRYRVLIYTAAYTGMRWGELAGLRVDRCNLLRGIIHVAEALTEVNGQVEVGPTKTGKTRAVSTPRFLRQLLSEHLADFPSDCGFVFTAEEEGPLRRSFYRRHFKPAVRRAGLPEGLRFHDLRHTCAALLIAQGAHPKEIQERLGHSTIKITFDRYGHLLPTLDERLRDHLDRLWEESQGRSAVVPLRHVEA
jgi:integrase